MKKSNLFTFLSLAVLMMGWACISFMSCEEEKEEPEVVIEESAWTEETYFSNTTGRDRKCWVLTPPNYSSKKQYPVLYLLHGIGGDHNEWKDSNSKKKDVTRTNLTKLINDGDAVPMIVVIPNVRAKVNASDSASGDVYGQDNIAGFNNFENDLKNDLMPFINSKYKTLTSRENTTVAGLSMGGMTTLNVMYSFPELAGWYGAFSSAPSFNGWTTTELLDPYKDSTYIMITCGDADNLYTQSQTYNQTIVDKGIQTYFYTYPGGGHGWNVWNDGLVRFAKRAFKTPYNYEVEEELGDYLGIK